MVEAPLGAPGGDSPAAETGADGPEDRYRLFRRPRDVRSFALTGLFVLAVFYTLYFARLFLLPIVLAILFGLLLSPLVRGLNRLRIPKGLGAGLVVLGLVGLTAGAGYLLVEPAGDWIDRAPSSMARIEDKLRRLKEPVAQMNRATQEVEKLTNVGGSAAAGEGDVQVQQVLRDSLSGTLVDRAQQFVAGVVVMLVLLYFLLASGDLFLRKLIRVLPTLDDKKRAVDIARQLEEDVSLYLSTITLINIGLGVCVAVAMHLLGLPNPVLWGVMATLLNFIPYLGGIIGIVVIAIVGVLTFDSPGEILLPPLVYFLLTASEGYFVTPMILGKRLTLNPVVILLGLIFWGWLWGIVGAVLAVPMLVSVKILCDHIPPLASVGEFLGR